MRPDPILRTLTSIAVALLSVIVLLLILQNVNREPFAERLDRIESQQEFTNCLLLIPFSEGRVERGVAECSGE